eukprot:scaffold276533_cov27-Prasinocladus_malaysianus.AAC.1
MLCWLRAGGLERPRRPHVRGVCLPAAVGRRVLSVHRVVGPRVGVDPPAGPGHGGHHLYDLAHIHTRQERLPAQLVGPHGERPATPAHDDSQNTPPSLNVNRRWHMVDVKYCCQRTTHWISVCGKVQQEAAIGTVKGTTSRKHDSLPYIAAAQLG